MTTTAVIAIEFLFRLLFVIVMPHLSSLFSFSIRDPLFFAISFKLLPPVYLHDSHQVSTLAASKSNTSLMSGGGALPEDVKRAEDYLKSRMGMRMTANTKQLTDEATAQVPSL